MNSISSDQVQNTINSKFGGIIKFSKQYQTKTFQELSNLVNPDVAPIQILSLFRNEMTKYHGLEYFAKDLLIRLLYQYFPNGWLIGNDFSRIKFYGNWCASLPVEFEDTADVIWNRLEFIEKGWVPSGINDNKVKFLFEGISFGSK